MLTNLDKNMRELQIVYSDWEEEERRHANIMGVYAILEQLGDGETDQRERLYQLKRLQYSPAYFSGHPVCCGERLIGSREFDIKQYEHAIGILSILGLLCSG